MTKEQFMEKVHPEPNGGCWIGIGKLDKDGYARFQAKGFKEKRLHRAAWVIFNGKIGAGLYVLHKCDVTACANPEHLFLGTAKDNFHDCIAKGRMPKKTHCKRGHAIVPENQTKLSNGQSRCRLCHAIRERARWQQKQNS